MPQLRRPSCVYARYPGFYCDFCKSAFTKEELDSKAGTETQSETTAPKEDGGHAVCYSCPSCGAQIVTDETTAATSCYYCHNPVILSGRFKEMEPDLVIPFAIEKEEAQESFTKWLKKKWFIPTAFRRESRVEELRGVYFHTGWRTARWKGSFTPTPPRSAAGGQGITCTQKPSISQFTGRERCSLTIW